jgi:hypothetical protein
MHGYSNKCHICNFFESQPMVFLSILWCNQSGDHPQEDLDKFGYKQDLKINSFKCPMWHSFTLWQACEGEPHFILVAPII